MSCLRFAQFVALAGAAVTLGCGNGSTPIRRNPVAPTPPTGPVIPTMPVTLECPADIEAISPDGDPVMVEFELPVLPNAGAEETVACEPAPGSAFPIGETEVACTGRSPGRLIDGCRFTVTVAEPVAPRLAFTTFMAFGDSITRGFVPTSSGDLPELSMSHLPPGESYPRVLDQMLGERYFDQLIIVENFGLGGETASRGRDRLPRNLDEMNPEVLLLLEGINGITTTSTSEIVSDLRGMVLTAQGRGIEVLIATLTPVSDAREAEVPGEQSAIRAVNEGIHGIAAELGIGPPVDLFSALSPALLSVDGKHPSLEGYRVIARNFFRAIRTRFELPPEEMRSLRWAGPGGIVGGAAVLGRR